MRSSSGYCAEKMGPQRIAWTTEPFKERIEADRCLVPNNEEVLDGLEGVDVVSKLDMFAAYGR